MTEKEQICAADSFMDKIQGEPPSSIDFWCEWHDNDGHGKPKKLCEKCYNDIVETIAKDAKELQTLREENARLKSRLRDITNSIKVSLVSLELLEML